MAYELTRYGEEYLETLPRRIEEKAEKARSKGIGVSRVSGWYPLMRRNAILQSIRREDEPVPNFSDEMLRRYPGKTKATQVAFKKELQGMLKENLVREKASGWEQQRELYGPAYKPGLDEGLPLTTLGSGEVTKYMRRQR